jgi:UDP-2,3-diacylglucosamine hydrolase
MTRPGGPVAILAGAGQLPIEVANRLQKRGAPYHILAFRGFATRELRQRADAVCDLLDLSAIQKTLEGWSPGLVTLAGAVRRPGFSALLGAYALFRNRKEVRDIIARGDDQVLRGAVSLLEERGFKVVGPHELVPDLLAASGFSAGPRFRDEDRPGVVTAVQLLDTLAPYDIGQAVVIAGRRVLAVEGPEGTDRMLQRVARIRRSWFRRKREGGVLVKVAKRGQDLRVDMPAIGPKTLTEAARAGLSGVAIGAQSTLILDREMTVAMADRLGVSLITLELPWASGQA